MNHSSMNYGIHTVETLLQKKPETIIKLWIINHTNHATLLSFIAQAKKLDLSLEFVSKKKLDQVTENGNHQGVLAYCQKNQTLNENDLKSIIDQHQHPFLLVLDGISDPHNLGAVFRSADAAGIHAIIAPKDKSVAITPSVAKVASGATFAIPFIQVTNLARTLSQLKDLGIWIYGTDENATQLIYDLNLQGPIAIVLGAEGTGLRRLTKDHCDHLMKIPMQGSVSSLNVSVATGICLFEAVRQRIRPA